MSIDIDWNAVTGGSDGLALAEAVRSFVHDKFQQVPLPRFIRAVQVHGFEFGSAAPLVELKDICDPLDDFYEEDESEDGYDTESSGNHSGNLRRTAREAGRLRSTITGWSGQNVHGGFHEPSSSNDHQDVHGEHEKRVRARGSSKSALPPYIDTRIPGLRSTLAPGEQLGSPLGPRSLTPTPGIPGGTSSLNYFHLPLSAGLSGTTTPLAAVAGAHFNNGGLEPPRARADSHSTLSAATPSISSVTPPSTADPTSRPISQHHEESDAAGSPSRAMQHDADEYERVPTPPQRIPRFRERSPQDIQIVAHVTYSGDIKMSLTAELLLDYPMESFVGIPLKLNITGLSFDGVAILAYIRRRAHFCFLSPEDADTLVGASHGTDESSACIDNDDSDDRAPRSAALDQRGSSAQRQHRLGGLLEQIHVESEIGDRENGKQVLKNVGKVEKFVLDEVRRIFDDEFVYPSFWTFLV